MSAVWATGHLRTSRLTAYRTGGATERVVAVCFFITSHGGPGTCATRCATSPPRQKSGSSGATGHAIDAHRPVTKATGIPDRPSWKIRVKAPGSHRAGRGVAAVVLAKPVVARRRVGRKVVDPHLQRLHPVQHGRHGDKVFRFAKKDCLPEVVSLAGRAIHDDRRLNLTGRCCHCNYPPSP